MYERFGDFIKQKRISMNLKQNEVAEKLGIKPCYLCDIESGNRNPLDFSKMEDLAVILGFSKKEKADMYDLAAKKNNLAPMDLVEYIMTNKNLRALLRNAIEKKINDKQWGKFLEQMRESDSR